MRCKIFYEIFLFSVFLYQQSHATSRKLSRDEETYAAFRPSDYFHTLEYELDLFTDVVSYKPANWSWGSVLITVECLKKTNKIFLDQEFIDIKENTIEVWKYTDENNSLMIPVLYGRNVSDNNGYKIKLEVYMYPNITYKVKLNFFNKMYSDNPGLVYLDYLQKHMHPTVKAMMYTRMRKLAASHVFPCFNRSKMKAKFRMKIGHLKNVNSLTNGKFASRQPIDNPKEWITGLNESDKKNLISKLVENQNEISPNEIPNLWVMDEFATTDTIRIASVALVVMDFHSVGPTIKTVGPPDSDFSEVEIRVWAEKDILNQMTEFLRVASESLVFYSRCFDTPYNVGKLDLIVLPDQGITVEDNYGLIYLGDEMVNNVLNKVTNYQEGYLVVSKICEAVGRQWIGHFVPLYKSREDWFYDGLHTYIQRHCVVRAYENWELPIQLEEINSFITLLRTAEKGRTFSPIKQLKPNSEYFPETLDHATKLKVHLIIRMLGFILGADTGLFKKMLSTYIEEFKSTDAPLKQVWKSFTTTINEERRIGLQIFPFDTDVKEIFRMWLGQRGYPILNVSRNEAGNEITVTQELFLLPNQAELSGYCWPVPFDIITKNHVMMRKWTTCFTKSVSIDVIDGKQNDWIIVSLQLHVPGRVHYDPKGWSLIQEMFHNKNEISRIDELTRIHMITDMFTLAEVSKLTYSFVFDTIKYISHEEDHTCLNIIYEELMRVRSRWIGTHLFEPFQKFVQTILEPVFKKQISNLEQFLKSERTNIELERSILLTVCTFEFPNCKQYSENLLTNMMTTENYEETNPIPEFFRGSAYCLAMINADEEKWNFLLDKYKKNPQDMTILEALGCSSNIIILKNYLKWSLGMKNSNISAAVGLKVFEILSSNNNQGYQLIRPFFAKYHVIPNKYQNAMKKFINKSKGHITIEDFLIKAVKGTRNTADLNMLVDFASTLESREEEKVFDATEAISNAERNISWFENNADMMSKYFATSSSTND